MERKRKVKSSWLDPKAASKNIWKGICEIKYNQKKLYFFLLEKPEWGRHEGVIYRHSSIPQQIKLVSNTLSSASSQS